jgi:hypothetical protein
LKSKCESGVSKDYAICNGVYCRLANDYYAPIIPRDMELRNALFKEFHDANLGGHLGIRKMYALMK